MTMTNLRSVAIRRGTSIADLWCAVYEKKHRYVTACSDCDAGLKLSDAAETEAWQLAVAELAANRAAAEAADVDEGGSTPGGAAPAQQPQCFISSQDLHVIWSRGRQECCECPLWWGGASY